jgi:hypothetical protein
MNSQAVSNSHADILLQIVLERASGVGKMMAIKHHTVPVVSPASITPRNKGRRFYREG